MWCCATTAFLPVLAEPACTAFRARSARVGIPANPADPDARTAQFFATHAVDHREARVEHRRVDALAEPGDCRARAAPRVWWAGKVWAEPRAARGLHRTGAIGRHLRHTGERPAWPARLV